MTIKTAQKKKTILSLLITLALALVYSLVYYYFNTPLGASIGSDNAIYLTMGTALANGYAPYTEIFDHKGPMVFILQTIPQLFSGGYSLTAVFIQEVVFLFACLCVTAQIARELDAPVLPVQAVYLALTCSLVGGGNLTEEYSNLFTLLGVLLALRAFAQAQQMKGKPLFFHALLMGAMTMLAFMTRANNALPLCAMALVLAAYLLVKKDAASFGLCAGGFALGLAIAALPIVLWLISQGALSEALYGSILHNMMYAETGGGSRLGMLLHNKYGHMAMVIAALSCLGALTLIRRAPGMALSMMAAAGAAGAAAFISHKFYDHYLMIGVPMAAAGAAAIFSASRKAPKKAYAALLICAMGICCVWFWDVGVRTNEQRLADRADLETFTREQQELYALVPVEDRDQFMAYRVEPRWYAVTGALPCMRFYFLQEVLAQADPAVMDEIVETFNTDPPEWLVIYYNREFGPPYDERVAEIFETKYAFIDSRGTYQLRRLKENP